MQKTEAQLKWVNSQIRKLETEKGKSDKADARAAAKEDKEWVSGIIDAAKQALREGEIEIAEIIADKQEEMDEKKRIEDEDKASMTLLKNAPMWLQDQLRAVKIGGEKEKGPTLATPTSIERFMNAMDRLGGYTSNIANMQLDPKLAEMRKQS